ncbi:hypothetical protein L2E82_05920 [Cichorium intybus]|uniref:Uncharacterized protein n=1 Tax=Cichorium intybus TaxID=13427 RepID=A0ACB9H955_CICIN|nr:hypothetical protein L2E82_05920 [Cichorium intybus]
MSLEGETPIQLECLLSSIGNRQKVQKDENEIRKKSGNTSSITLCKGGKGNKRKNDVSIEKENAFVEKPVKIEIPSALKKQLVDDWEFVNHQLLKSNLCMKPMHNKQLFSSSFGLSKTKLAQNPSPLLYLFFVSIFCMNPIRTRSLHCKNKSKPPNSLFFLRIHRPYSPQSAMIIACKCY